MGKASLCEPSLFSRITTWFGFQLVMIFALLKEKLFDMFNISFISKRKPGYAVLMDPMKAFFFYHAFGRAHDCNSRPISSRPERIVSILKRKHHSLNSKLSHPIVKPKKELNCLNFGSYNYLGFSKLPQHCEHNIFDALHEYGISGGGNRNYGYNTLIRDLEERIADYVGKDDCFIMGMGYASNSMVISTLTGKGDLILADKLSHSSAWVGCFHSDAEYHSFNHNDFRDLEKKIKYYIAQGQIGSTRDHIIPWKRIWVVFEGIYSMEGEFAPLDKFVELKEKYGVYLYMDEAHSMGGTGRRGRGACDVFNIPTSKVDIMMGTFTKAFGSIGGYVAADQVIVDYLKEKSYGTRYGTVLPPVAAAQVQSCHKLLIGEDGTDFGKKAIEIQRKNALRLFKGLKKIGLEIVGQEGSPVMCVMLYNLSKLMAFSRLCLKRGLAVCIAGYPAVAFYENRARFCVSAQHSKQDIDNCIRILDEVGDTILIKYKLPWYKRLKSLFL